MCWAHLSEAQGQHHCGERKLSLLDSPGWPFQSASAPPPSEQVPSETTPFPLCPSFCPVHQLPGQPEQHSCFVGRGEIWAGSYPCRSVKPSPRVIHTTNCGTTLSPASSCMSYSDPCYIPNICMIMGMYSNMLTGLYFTYFVLIALGLWQHIDIKSTK